MKIAIAGLHEVDTVWPLVAKGFQRAFRREQGKTLGELWTMCRTGNAFLVILAENNEILMASIWRFHTKDGTPVFRCESMYGNRMSEWVEYVYSWIENLARENGAKKLVAEGRRGWLRMFDGVVTNGLDMEIAIDGQI